jgi:hypothetical protein
MILKVVETQSTSFFEILDENLISEIDANKTDKSYMKSFMSRNKETLTQVQSLTYDVCINIAKSNTKMLKAVGAIK